MLCMSPNLVLLLLLWEKNCTGLLEVPLPPTISLFTAKQCSKLISQTRKFVFLMIRPQGKKKTVATTSRNGSSA